MFPSINVRFDWSCVYYLSYTTPTNRAHSAVMEIRPHSRPERQSNEVLLDVGSDINTLTETFVRNQAKKEWRGPKFPNYATYKQRLHSFANWPRNTSSREELSAAGFYYTGTYCSHCI
jgi:hypothetical protein